VAKPEPAALVIGIGKGHSLPGGDDEHEPGDSEGMGDDDSAGSDAVKAFFEAGAKKDYGTAYDALASAVALCKGEKAYGSDGGDSGGDEG
jgi:hypothetical protein